MGSPSCQFITCRRDLRFWWACLSYVLHNSTAASKLLVPVMEVVPEPVKLSGLVNLWDSGGSSRLPAGEAEHSSGRVRRKNSGVGGVWLGHGARLSVGLKLILANHQVTQEEAILFHTVCNGGDVLLTSGGRKNTVRISWIPLTCLPYWKQSLAMMHRTWNKAPVILHRQSLVPLNCEHCSIGRL